MAAKERVPQLQVDDRIRVAVQGTSESNPAAYLSRVAEAACSDYLIEWPISGGLRAPVRDRDVLLITFNAQGWVYCFDACVMARKQDQTAVLKVRQLGATRRIQRRDYVRVSATIEVELATRVIHTAADESGPVDPIAISTRTINLSGGGFAICHSNALPVGTLFDVKLKIAKRGEPLSVTAKVIRSKPLDVPVGEFAHEIGFAFVELTEVIRRRIMSYLIRLQQASVLST